MLRLRQVELVDFSEVELVETTTYDIPFRLLCLHFPHIYSLLSALYCRALLLFTTATPPNTSKAATIFCHVRISMPIIMLITAAIMG